MHTGALTIPLINTQLVRLSTSFETAGQLGLNNRESYEQVNITKPTGVAFCDRLTCSQPTVVQFFR